MLFGSTSAGIAGFILLCIIGIHRRRSLKFTLKLELRSAIRRVLRE